MTIRDLKYLVALASHQHFGKAAEACFVSQPALSMQIKKLERTLGVTLLERTNKSVLLTEIGSVIAARAQGILQQIAEMHDIANLAKDPFSGELKLGIFPTLAPYFLPLIMPMLVKTFPKLSFYLIEEQTAILLEKLKSGKLDAAFLALPVNDAQLTHTVLFEEAFLLATPTNHPLAKRKKIAQQDLQQQHLLLLDEGHCMREQALQLCQHMQAHEKQNFRATSLETLRHMIVAGVGITLMPKLACQLNDAISYIPFSAPTPARTIGLVWRTATAKQVLLNKMTTQIKIIMTKIKSL